MIRKMCSLALCLGLLFSGCSKMKAGPDEATARDFMEAYYVKADLKEAQSLTDSLALDKVKGSESLREGLSIDAQAFHPRVTYQLVESKSGPEESEFIYDVEFHPEKAAEVRKKTRVKVKLRGGHWKVTQFTDHDL